MKSDKILSIQALGFPWQTQDPFLFCVHHLDHYPQGNSEMAPNPEELKGRAIGQDFNGKDGWSMYHGQKIPGFPYHPHRGFETVTISRQGFIDHSDSLGAAGRFGNGDVQWMTAGKGVQHSEMFPLLHQDQTNTTELFQIWLNLPRKSKLVEPHFAMLWAEDIPKVVFSDAQGHKTQVDLIAGQLNGTSAPPPAPNSWANEPNNEVAIWTIHMEAGAEWTLPAASPGIHRSLYFYQGERLQVEGEDIPQYHSAQVKAEAELSLKNGSQPSFLLLLQGRPIQEPVAQHGPFVMNTQMEIQQAFMDYQKTQFGGWPWPQKEQVHARDKGRFALYPDGKEEKPV